MMDRRFHGSLDARKRSGWSRLPRLDDEGGMSALQSRAGGQRCPRRGLCQLQGANVGTQRILVLLDRCTRKHGAGGKPDIERDIGIAIGKRTDTLGKSQNLAVEAWPCHALRTLAESATPRQTMHRALCRGGLYFDIARPTQAAKQNAQPSAGFLQSDGGVVERSGRIELADKGMPELADALFRFPGFKAQPAHDRLLIRKRPPPDQAVLA